jgi:outer membrane protein TolC
MKKLVILLLFASWSITAQQIHLDYCLNQVSTHYPLLKQQDIEKELNEISKKVNQSVWLPQIALNGQASYQSDVTEINIPGSTIEFLSKDQYKMYVDINQTVYDGGVTKIKNDLQNITTQINTNNVEIEILNIKQQTQKYFFNALMAQENYILCKTSQNEIKERIKVLEAGVKHGTIKQSQVDILEVELYKIDQKIIQTEFNKKIAIQVINLFTGLSIKATDDFSIPADTLLFEDSFVNRPEFKKFDFQKESLDKNNDLTHSHLLPKVQLFGQGGYGRPGLNQLSNEFDAFYIVGTKLNWDLSGFYNKKKNKKITELQKNSVEVQKETLEYNLKSQKINLEQTANQLTALIEKDQKIVDLRKNISKVAASELDNGVITSTSFLIEKNAEIQAKQSLKIHQIQKMETQCDIKLLTGN